MTAPGRRDLGPLVERFDTAADRHHERIRGNPAADWVFRTATKVGDFSAIWHVVNLARGIVLRRPDQVVALGVALGVESLVVNQGVKRLFGRARPTVSGDARTQVRTPVTSSFPSGHASAAAFNATILTIWDRDRGRGWIALWWVLAATVGVSRAHVRIHHASDVVGGAVVGVALGLVARPIIGRFVRE